MSIIYSVSLVYRKASNTHTETQLKTGICSKVTNRNEALGTMISNLSDKMEGFDLFLHVITEIDTKEYELVNEQR